MQPKTPIQTSDPAGEQSQRERGSTLPTLREVFAQHDVDPSDRPDLAVRPEVLDMQILGIHVGRDGVDYETCLGYYSFD